MINSSSILVETKMVMQAREAEWTAYIMHYQWMSKEVEPGADCGGLCDAQGS